MPRKIKFRKLKKIKPSRTSYEIVQFKLKRIRIAFYSLIVIFFASFGAFIYFHYDYLIFRNLIARNYILTDNLDAMFYEHLGFVPDNYSRYFDNLVISVFTDELQRFGSDRFTYLYTPSHLELVQQIRQIRGLQSELYEIAPGVGVLRILNTSSYVRNFVSNNIDYLASFDNLILDLRGNSGGLISTIHYISNLFLERGEVISSEIARLGFFTSTETARGSRQLEFDNIIILQDGRTASAGEMLIAALAENLDNVTTIGTTTYGKGIGQVTIPLRRGFAVRATVIIIETPFGNRVHGVGLMPDIEFEGEEIIEFAINLLEDN